MHLLAAINLQGIAYWAAGLFLSIVSLGISLQILKSKSNLWQALLRALVNVFRFQRREMNL
jgi:hypothetical protein